ncbi:MAG TPA: cobalamin-dependent protein [bacterium]|nr:cobalamin-dependent protein [bacterium]
MKILFLHIPAGYDEQRKQNLALFNMVMPIGFLGLADLMEKSGHSVEVIHAGLEIALNRNFEIASTVGTSSPDLIVVSLHFHHQLWAINKILKSVKKHFPDIPIATGGFTAGFFYREIMRKWHFIDFLIRGDGEAPLYQLANSIENKKDLFSVPNLSFRSGGKIIHTSFSYCASESVINNMTFTNLALLRNSDFYSGSFLWSRKKGINDYLNNKYFYLYAGRGCSVNCTFCAGSRTSQKIISNRPGPIFRSAESIYSDIMNLSSHSKENLYLCFDPPRKTESPYMELMKLLREQNNKFSMIFEVYRKMPSKKFISDFSNTFEPAPSALAFSPSTFNEELRKFHTGTYFSNESLENALESCSKKGVNTVLYFTLFPEQSFSDLKKEAARAQKLADKYGSEPLFLPLEIEPGSPWHLNPEKFNLDIRVRSFEDFVEFSKKRSFNRTITDTGYQFPELDKKMDFLKSRNLTPADYTKLI